MVVTPIHSSTHTVTPIQDLANGMCLFGMVLPHPTLFYLAVSCLCLVEILPSFSSELCACCMTLGLFS